MLKSVHEFCLGESEDPLHVLLRRFSIAILEILPNRPEDKHWLLANVPDHLAQFGQIQSSDIVSTELNLASSRVIESVDQLDDRALARAGWTNDSC